MRIEFWIPNATNAYSQYVILIAFPLQQFLHERASMLRYTYIACLVPSNKQTSERENLMFGLEIIPFYGVDNSVMKVTRYL